MNFDADNTKNAGIMESSSVDKKRRLNISRVSSVFALIAVVIMCMIFLFGADLSVYKTEKTLSAGIFDSISDKDITTYNLYDDKWLLIGILVMSFMVISAIIANFRYNCVPNIFIDGLGFVLPGVLSAILMIGTISIFSFSDFEGLTHGGLSYYERAGEEIGGGGFWICVIIVLYVVWSIKSLVARFKLASEIPAEEEDVPETVVEPVEKAIVTADDFFSRYNAGTKTEGAEADDEKRE